MAGRTLVAKPVKPAEARLQQRAHELKRVFRELDVDTVGVVPKRDIAVLGHSHTPENASRIWAEAGLRHVWTAEDHTEVVHAMPTDDKGHVDEKSFAEKLAAAMPADETSFAIGFKIYMDAAFAVRRGKVARRREQRGDVLSPRQSQAVHSSVSAIPTEPSKRRPFEPHFNAI